VVVRAGVEVAKQPREGACPSLLMEAAAAGRVGDGATGSRRGAVSQWAPVGSNLGTAAVDMLLAPDETQKRVRAEAAQFQPDMYPDVPASTSSGWI
jgi:hypothetical protein